MKRKVSWVIVLAGAALLSGCSGNGRTTANQASLAGNWQFTLYDASNNSPPKQGGITGGFLQQKGNSVTGSLAYATYVPGPNGNMVVCAGGSAPVTGTMNGQSLTFTAQAGGQTYTFTGTLSNDGSTIGMASPATYTSTDGPPLAGGGTCGTGTGQTSLKWTAVSVLPLTGSFQGSFHSVTGGTAEDFAVTGSLTQAENTGDAYASLTGTIQFAGYPCLSQAGLNGTISGSSVILYIVGPDGLAVGSIGQNSQGGGAPLPATLQSGATGRLLLSVLQTSGGGYHVATTACPAIGGNSGDSGNVCLGLAATIDCGVPITFSPAPLKFPSQVLGTIPSTQAITLTNTDPLGQSQTLMLTLGSTLFGLGGLYGADVGDFNVQPHYSEQDTCGPSPFTLVANQSCTIYISFSPQESCTWDPTATPPPQCPMTLPAYVRVTTSSNPIDGDNGFELPITGTGLSAITAFPPELDFGEEDPNVGEQSDPQTVVFTNQAPYPVQILPSVPCVSAAQLPNPLVPGTVPGIQIVNFEGFNASPLPARPQLACDALPPDSDFPIMADNCSGLTLQPQQVCTVSIASNSRTTPFVATIYYLELNTLQCVFPNLPSATNPCEIDAGRYPVVLTRQLHGDSLRMSPTAGLTFATQAVGTTSAPQTITLLNDQSDSNPAPLTFETIVANGDYAQTNTCGSVLAVGQSCAITITFTPTKTGLRQGSVVITLPPPINEKPILLRGTGK